MSQRFTSLLLFISIWVQHTFAGQQDIESVGSQRIQVEDVVLQVPATWNSMTTSDTIRTLLSPLPSEDSFRNNIRIKKYALKGGDDLDTILMVQEKTIGEKYKTIGSGVLVEGNPRITWLATSEREPEPGYPLLAKIDYMMIHHGQLIVLHAMCETSKFDESQSVFDAIVRSIQLTRPTLKPQSTIPENRNPPNSPAFEQGRMIGRYTCYIMVIVIGLWLIFRGTKFV